MRLSMGFRERLVGMRIEEIHNLVPLKAIIDLLSSAEESVFMSTRLSPDFYNMQEVRDAFQRKVVELGKKNCGNFHVLLDAGVDWAKREQEMPWLHDLEPYLTIRQSLIPVPHWIIVDNKNFRLEQPHAENVIQTSNILIWGASKPIADNLLTLVNPWWNQAVPIER